MLNLEIGIRHPSIARTTTFIATTLLIVRTSRSTLTTNKVIGVRKETNFLDKIGNLGILRRGAPIKVKPHKGKIVMVKGPKRV